MDRRHQNTVGKIRTEVSAEDMEILCMEIHMLLEHNCIASCIHLAIPIEPL